MDVSVCIVNWNTRELLYKCIKSIEQKTFGLTYEIIIVDNGSEDGSAEMVKKEFPDCKLIESENVGFARGNNKAVKDAIGKYIFYLNPDTELITNAIYGMFVFLEENKDYGAVGCKLLNKDGSIQFTCARMFPAPFIQFCYLAMLYRIFPGSRRFSTTEMEYWSHNSSREVECLSGACIMTRKKIIDQLGGFDETYFMYGEDIELCYRIRKNGWHIYYLSEEVIFHYSGASSNQREEKYFSTILQQESNHTFMKENYGILKATQFRIAVFLGSIIRLTVIALLLPIFILNRKHQKYISLYSLKKYFYLLLWSIKVKTTNFHIKRIA